MSAMSKGERNIPIRSEKSGEKHAEGKGREPGNRAKPERPGANFLRAELEPRLEKQEYQAEFPQESDGALACDKA